MARALLEVRSWTVVVGIHELLRAEADDPGDRLPAMEQAAIHRASERVAPHVLDVLGKPRTVEELVHALEETGIKTGRPIVWDALLRLEAKGLAVRKGRRGTTVSLWQRTRRAGRSRGPGGGSRMRLYECTGCERPQKVRVASDDFEGTHTRCGTAFVRADPSPRSNEKGAGAAPSNGRGS